MKVVRAFLLVLVAATSAWAADNCQLASGWQPDAPSRTYTANDLYDYVDGGAEGYLVFGFVRLEHQTCVKGADSLVIDVSEMNDPDAAYGLFTARRGPCQPLQAIGMGGVMLPNWASFAKGKYYVELSATPGKEYRPVLRAFTVALEKRLTGRSTPPETLAWFPKGYTSARLVPQSVLGLEALKRGYVAEYGNGQAFVVTETSAPSATAVLAALWQRFAGAQAAKVADEAFEFKDPYLGAMCVFRKGQFLGGYAHVRETAKAVLLARTLASRLPQR